MKNGRSPRGIGRRGGHVMLQLLLVLLSLGHNPWHSNAAMFAHGFVPASIPTGISVGIPMRSSSSPFQTANARSITPIGQPLPQQQHQQQHQQQQQQQQTSTALSAASKGANKIASNNALRSKLYMALSKFLISPIEAWKVMQQVSAYMHWTECGLIAMWVVAPVPVARWWFRWRNQPTVAVVESNSNNDANQVAESSASPSQSPSTKKVGFFSFFNRSDDQDEDDDEQQQLLDEAMEAKFRTSRSRQIANILRQVGLLQAALYASDVLFLALKLLKFQFVTKNPIQKWAATIIISFWCARNLSVAKWHFIMHNSYSRSFAPSFAKLTGRKPPRRLTNVAPDEFAPDKLGFSNRLLNRAADVLIYSCTLLLVIDILPFQMGLAFKSIFGLSSLGTLIFSLASKDVASQFLASLAIEGSNLFQEGEEILLYDGTQGIVQKMGWLHTHIRRGDEMVTRIPNSQIATNRVANVSRTKLCQVKQSISIRYEDIDKLPQLMDDIKHNIRARCGRLLIDNGARPFRVDWREYRLYSVEVVIDAHFRNRPSGNAYWDLRQSVLYAIYDATQKNDVKFSYTNFLGSDVLLAGGD